RGGRGCSLRSNSRCEYWNSPPHRRRWSWNPPVCAERQGSPFRFPTCSSRHWRASTGRLWLPAILGTSSTFDGRGPQRGCAARPASARTGMGTPEPHAGAALAGTAPALLAGGGPPCGISRPFAPTLPAVQTARPPRAEIRTYPAPDALDRWRARQGRESLVIGHRFLNAQPFELGQRGNMREGDVVAQPAVATE